MRNKKVRGLLGLVFAITTAAVLAGCSDNRREKEAQIQAGIQARTRDIPADFDWKLYVDNYPDLGKAGIDTAEEAMEHWRNWGKREGRTYHEIGIPDPFADESFPGDFDWEMNIADDEDTQTADESLPSDFDWRTYVDNYKDLQEEGVDTKEKAVEHWLKTGRKEGRTYREIPTNIPDVPYGPWRKASRDRQDLR